MILQGSQRGGARNLALHLLKDENEHVEIHELRGFVAGDLESALKEVYAVSRGTKAKQFLFSLSLNPPANEPVTTGQFEDAIGRVEDSLGLSGQPRAIVFHEKHGRRHAHAVWSRIDAQNMKAIQLSFTRYKLRDISRELFLEHGWKMPEGYANSSKRDPKNFTMAEWQQAKRARKDSRAIKAALQDSWAISDTQQAFTAALEERGYVLARGDRRGVVALDHRCEVYSISKWVGIKAKQVQSKVSDPDTLPSVAETRSRIAKTMAGRLDELAQQQAKIVCARLGELETQRMRIVKKQQQARSELKSSQKQRWVLELNERQRRYSRGLRGLLERFTGKHKEIKKLNERESLAAMIRDREERDALVFSQLDERQRLQARIERLNRFNNDRSQKIALDGHAYKQVQRGEREKIEPHKQSPRLTQSRGTEPRL